VAKKKGKAKPLRDRVTQQAQSDAALRYAPQRRELTAQQQSIADQFATQARVEQASAKGISESIDQVKPKVAGYTSNATNLVNQGAQDLGQYLSGSVLQGAAARDAVNTRGRLAEMLAGANTELDQRKIDATAGAKYTIGALRASAGKALEDVGGKLSDLASDEGTYAATQADKLRQSAANRALTRRGQDLSHEDRVASREAADRRAAARDEKTKSKLLSPKDQSKAADEIAEAVSHAQDLLRAGRSRGEVAQILTEGRASQSVTDPKTGQVLKTPARPKLPRDYVLAALDIVVDKHISLQKQQALQQRGIQVSKLGYTTAGQYRTQVRRASPPRVARDRVRPG
jgi:hypothetical protein